MTDDGGQLVRRTNLTCTPSNPLRRIAASAGEKIGLTMVYSDIIVLALVCSVEKTSCHFDWSPSMADEAEKSA